MKKFKKLLAGLLAGAMMLGSMTATAFAEDGGTVASTQATTPATIDTTKLGSLTIHKYEYNGTDTAHKGTGSEKDAVPEGAKALEGAGFTLYKVANVDDLTKYYSTNPEALPNVDSYLSNGKIDSLKVKETISEVKTGKDGIAKFENLTLGFYVVIETTTPDKVTTPAAPFLVSIPMTTVDGDNWLYDVHVYPKNKTTYGGVTLEKKENNTTPLCGVTFELQKQNGTGWTKVTKNESDNSDLSLETDSEGKITVNGLSQGTYRFIETDRGNNDGYIMDGATTYEFVVGADGKTTYNKKTENNITITVNNEKPDMTKQVKNRTVETWKHDADYNIGDMVPYKITIDVPSNITKLKDFTLTDTPTNLDDKIFNENKSSLIEIKCDNSAIDANAYRVEKKDEHGFKITFTPAKMIAYAGKQLVIAYNAELLNTAVTTTAGNPNTAKLEYSNKILPESNDTDNPNSGKVPGKDSIEDNAIVYTFNLKISKKANNVNGASLGGVKFDLYKYTGTNQNPTEADLKGTDGILLKVGLETSSTDGAIKGTVSYPGLANGTYYLVETKTVDGYNLLKEPVKVTLNIQYTTSMSESWSWTTDSITRMSTLVKHNIDTSKTVFSGNDTSTSTDGTHTETIINKKGFTLPTTGGMGTVIFSVLGIALVLAGLLVISASRKKAAK